jgi:hypothetical protein
MLKLNEKKNRMTAYQAAHLLVLTKNPQTFRQIHQQTKNPDCDKILVQLVEMGLAATGKDQVTKPSGKLGKPKATWSLTEKGADAKEAILALRAKND